ncbi:uncharacterized protein LOC117114560 isoform X1 [Anneissia japonica]|uniref:uncharacterized protein LOC117114560 isoform X1 n=1 Tax=Anneissia japonica TaxID=1529436 RepID=UPI001425910B|nr:uncharacterized protein LOC117114560 isoform X1 [Anneissia japonica]
MTIFQLHIKQLLGLLLGYACNQFAQSHEITTPEFTQDEEDGAEGGEHQWIITTLIVVGLVSMTIILGLCIIAFYLSSPTRVKPPGYGIDASRIPSSPDTNLVQYEAQLKYSDQSIDRSHQSTSYPSAINPFVNILMTEGEKSAPQPIIPQCDEPVQSIAPEFPRDVEYGRSNRFKKAVNDRRKRDLFENILRKTKRLNQLQTQPSLYIHNVEINIIMNKNCHEANGRMAADNDHIKLRDLECDNMANNDIREVVETHCTQKNNEYNTSQKSLVLYKKP